MAQDQDTVAREMADAASDLVASLDPAQREAISFDFNNTAERCRWYYTPTDHGGLPLADMNSLQQQRGFRLMASGLSVGAYNTAVLIMSNENILDLMDGWYPARFGRRARDPMMYRFSIFGSPAHEVWAWRLGGHHLSLNYTIVSGRVEFKPAFMGADPSESPLAGGHLFRPFAGIEDRARDLVWELNSRQRDAAVISEIAPFDLMTGNSSRLHRDVTLPHLWQPFREMPPEIELLKIREAEIVAASGLTQQHLARLQWARTPKGLKYTLLNARQRQMLANLIAQYIDRLPTLIASRESRRIEQVKEELHFAWAGSLIPHEPHYYRIQGPRLLIEYDNFQRSGAHVHSVWRDPEGDFGEDVLTSHIRNHH
jgi:hypothetical protein